MMGSEFKLRPIAVTMLVLFAVLGCTGAAFADGGRLRFRKPAGPFIITLFTTPDPLTAGQADFSVAVERSDAPGLVENAHVDFILTPAQGHGGQLVLHASHAAATSKWLQAASVSLPTRGVWRIMVVARSNQQVGECSGEVLVEGAGSRNLLWDIFPVPLAALLLLVHENRKRMYSRARRTRMARPSSAIHT